MATVLLDTHVVHWRSAEPERLSPSARRALDSADEFVVASTTWFELAWLVRRERILISLPVRAWLQRLAENVRTIPITPEIAAAATALPSSFPRDPADRLIYATAIEHGFHLVSKDRAIRDHGQPGATVIW
ncbi:MAG TPA: type II toxin-antitoxin system VapC family toxin [Solirubrobacterales bacterium]|nr:type II toxin-antitoxin system VapC family toxin [Solirubrobacterales bacterium]